MGYMPLVKQTLDPPASSRGALKRAVSSFHTCAVIVSPDHARPRLPIGSLASPVPNWSPLVRPISLPWVTDSYITARFLSPGLLIALMMEAARTSETLVNFYQITRCYNPEDSNLYIKHVHRQS
jgi:hypothetical protein